MKIIFNDATEISVQAVKTFGDYLNILTVGNTPEQLRVLFEDTGRTAKMTVQERGQTVGVYEGYTAFYRTEIYTGKIYGVTMYRPERTPEVQEEVQKAAIAVAQIQAQSRNTIQTVYSTRRILRRPIVTNCISACRRILRRKTGTRKTPHLCGRRCWLARKEPGSENGNSLTAQIHT